MPERRMFYNWCFAGFTLRVPAVCSFTATRQSSNTWQSVGVSARRFRTTTGTRSSTAGTSYIPRRRCAASSRKRRCRRSWACRGHTRCATSRACAVAASRAGSRASTSANRSQTCSTYGRRRLFATKRRCRRAEASSTFLVFRLRRSSLDLLGQNGRALQSVITLR
eukprot:4998114-Pleurochrysis_carterae.AAC.5